MPRTVLLSLCALLGFGIVGCDVWGTSGEVAVLEDEAGSTVDVPLRFRPDSSFTIVQFTDTQDDHEIDPRTVRLMEAVLDDQSPDLVIFTGDNIRSGPETAEDVRRAIGNIAKPVEDRAIPWLVAFGNHDQDHFSSTGMDEEGMLELYMTFPHNLNRPGPSGVHGTGNMQIPILASGADSPVFSLWVLDSGRYAPDQIGGQSLEADGLPGWDMIRASQIAWYAERSIAMEAAYGRKIPGLMFFHIPLWEFRYMWENRERHQVVGEKNEEVSSGPFNSGLFAALVERGDVRGVFVGHDHVNTYVGDYFGIKLGYSANTGFGTYGLEGTEKDRLRGARVFHLPEARPADFQTYMVFARDYGLLLGLTGPREHNGQG
jgi:3',5'-cyclic AMP phosphodiesterase CpdA